MAHLLAVGIYAYLLATIVLSVWFFSRKDNIFWVGFSITGIGAIAQLVFLGMRWVVGGRPPFSNTFETLVLMSALAGVTFVVLMLMKKEYRPLSAASMLGILMVALMAGLNMDQVIKPLVPALQNNFWLTTHVVVSFVSYAAFLLTYVVGLVFLLLQPKHCKAALYTIAFSITGTGGGLYLRSVYLSYVGRPAGQPGWHDEMMPYLFGAFFVSAFAALIIWPLLIKGFEAAKIKERLPDVKLVENLALGITKFGFAFLTLCILTGSVWAGSAWGRYWGWDPKETSSLVTWIVFAIYLHLRITPKWRGEWNMWVAVAGFWCVLFTYFGANYLLKGIHAFYAS